LDESIEHRLILGGVVFRGVADVLTADHHLDGIPVVLVPKPYCA
jgi:hypothetical protein